MSIDSGPFPLTTTMYKSDRNGKFGSKRNFGGRGFNGSGRTVMHKAVCDECGKTCEVPFKPTGDRPVYCNNCFKKNENGDSRRPQRDDRKNYDGGKRTDQYQEQFAIINSKLDEILEALTNIAEEEDDNGDEA